MTTLGFVGLGAMGSRLAARLLAAGHTVVGYNRTADKARGLVDAGLRVEKTPRAVAEASDVVFSMVTDNAALRAVALGPDGVVAGLRAGAIFVELSTVSPLLVRELAGPVGARGAALLDAAISGSTISVETGQASIQVAGDPSVVERVKPYLAVIGPLGTTHVGDLGLAKTMKIAINLGLAVQMLSFCEGVLLAEKSGIPRERAVEALMKSVIASPMVKYRGPFVLGEMPRDAWFSVPMIQKDMQLALDHGHAIGVPLPTTALTQQWLTAARGLGDYDFAVIFDVLAALADAAPSRKPR